MTELVVDFPRTKVGNPRFKGLDKSFRDATADYLRRRWPQHTAKSASRTFDLSLDKAKEAVRGNASLTTVEKIFKEGGLTVALPILEEVIGQSVAHHLREMREHHEEHGRRLAALVGDWGAVPDRRRHDPPGLDHPQGERREPDRRRVG